MKRRSSNDSTNLAGVESLFHNDPSLTIKLLSMNHNQYPNLRRSGLHRTASAGGSGSEYLASEKSVEMQREPTPEPPVEFTKSRSGRRVVKVIYEETSDSEIPHAGETYDEPEDRPRKSFRLTRRAILEDEDEDEGEAPVGRSLRKSNRLLSSMYKFIEVDESAKMHAHGRYLTRNRSKKASPQTNGSFKPPNQQPQQSQRTRRLTRRTAAHVDQEDDFFSEPHTSSGASTDADEPEHEPEHEHEPEPEEEVDGKPYALRQRQKINYAIPPPLEDMPGPTKSNEGLAGGYHGGGHGRAGGKGRTLGWNASGAELGRWMGMPDSDSDYVTQTPRKPFGGIAPNGAVAGPAGGGMIGDLAAGGTPSNLGKIGDKGAMVGPDPSTSSLASASATSFTSIGPDSLYYGFELERLRIEYRLSQESLRIEQNAAAAAQRELFLRQQVKIDRRHREEIEALHRRYAGDSKGKRKL